MVSTPFAVNECLVVNASVTRSERQTLKGKTLKVKCIVSTLLGTELKKKKCFQNVIFNIIQTSTIPRQSNAIGCWSQIAQTDCANNVLIVLQTLKVLILKTYELHL